MSETLKIDRAEIEVTVDNKGIPCALGIFKVMREMERITPGRVIEIISTDRASKRDLAKWTNRVGHQILAVDEEGNVLRPILRIFIRKKL
ncbi:MAG: sulfurtransferase TusA family protein [Chloroflexi bacterium]|nr:sulfurtransferase TusA family protein [Chloroflexota bacterium]